MKAKNVYILFLIIVVATILRVYNLFNIPFTHDEFSMLFRLDFDNFDDLITHGVLVDFHPAGVQVFAYYWTALFGTEEWVIKAPFILMGIISIYLVYKLGKLWRNETVGLVAAAFMAVSQYTVMYSQIARPYASGLFFSLLLMLFWSRLMLHPDKRFNINAVGFVLAGSLCAYNHHFSMLFAGIVGITGLFMIEKKYFLRYLIAGAIVLLLYLPHVPILLHQLGKGGVEEWLAKPDNDFLFQYIKYVFNYSWIFIALVVAIILYGWIKKKESMKKSYYLLFALFFFLPFFIGFFYSKYVSAVLQFSILIFSFPFLYFLLFGHFKKLNFSKNLIIVSAILIVGTISLVFEREHYSVFYKDHFKYSLTDLHDARKSKGELPGIIDVRKDILYYYAENSDLDTNFRWFTSFQSMADLHRYILEQSKTEDYFYLGANSINDPVVIPMIQEYYPYLVWQRNYFIGTNYLFSKSKKSDINNRELISHLDFSDVTANEYWQPFPSESISEGSLIVSEHIEWTPSFEAEVSDIVHHKNDFIDIVLKYNSNNPVKDVILVTEITKNEESIHWNGFSFDSFSYQDSLRSESVVFGSIKLSDIPEALEGKVKIYLWNKGLKSLKVEDIKIYRRKGNPIIYGLFNEIN